MISLTRYHRPPPVSQRERAGHCRLATLVIAWSLASATLSAEPLEPACQSQLQHQVGIARTQSYFEFDQREGEGFRRLDKSGCPYEAGLLIDIYLTDHPEYGTILSWHAAQMFAKAGHYETAIARARTALVQTEPVGFRWNDYVEGTVAFLNRDVASLRRHRDRLAEAATEFPNNEANLRVLNRLLSNFEKSYAEALKVDDQR